ncbi:MAG: hypothetical protein KBT47_04555 [Armatimonadetes bacterium]|nr:hypothetical protein [Candidatus Hippobium faecium]
MPIPLIVGGIFLASGILSIPQIKGAYVNFKSSIKNNKDANRRVNIAEEILVITDEKTTKLMDEIGYFELKIQKSFGTVEDILERIHNKPEFNEFPTDGFDIPKFDKEKIHKVSIGSGALMGSVSGAGLGVAGSIAAEGITTFLVSELATASTGTAISKLSGAAATKATLAAIGGGPLSIGGGGVALGNLLLGSMTGGISILIGSWIMNKTSQNITKKVDAVMERVEDIEERSQSIVLILNTLYDYAGDFYKSLTRVARLYMNRVNKLEKLVDGGKTDWNDFTENEKKLTHNVILSVQILCAMIQTKLFPEKQKELPLTAEITEKVLEAKKQNPGCEMLMLDMKTSRDSIDKVYFNVKESKLFESSKYLNGDVVKQSVKLGNDFADNLSKTLTVL